MTTFQHGEPNRRSGAFTLIEIILVLSIIALLLGVGIANLDGIWVKGKIVKARRDMDVFKTSLVAFQIDAGRYPTEDEGLGALRRKPNGVRRWSGPYMERMPIDPWDRKYEYRMPGRDFPDSPDVFSAGPDGLVGNDDDVWLERGAEDDVY